MSRILSLFSSDGTQRALRYVAVSAAGVICTQVLLLAAVVPFGLRPAVANVVACLGASLPVFSLNRRWVWEMQGPASVRREVVPFWSLTLLGLAVSTLAVAAAATISASPLVLSATNIGAFGLLWVAKYLVLDDAAQEAAAVAVFDERHLEVVAA